MGITVPDEYLDRYRGVPHHWLYQQLMAGEPDHTDRVSDTWSSAGQMLVAAGAQLTADLAALAPFWGGEPGAEFQRRLGLVAAFANDLAAQAVAVHTGLSLMSGMLAIAQREARTAPPEEAAEWDNNGLLGPALGRLLPALQRERLHERLTGLVAQLAVDYALAERQTWNGPRPDPSLGLPGSDMPESPPSTVESDPGPPGGAPARCSIAAAAPVSTMGGAGAVPASAEPTHLIAATAGSGSGAAAGSSMPMAPLGMGGGGAAGTESGEESRRPHGSGSWSAGEHLPWQDDDDAPPPILGA
jgi:hypothetical protein